MSLVPVAAARNISNVAEGAEMLDADQEAARKTAELKQKALEMHRYYAGKLQVLPKCPVTPHLLNLWYTPGVSAVSCAIRDNNDESFSLTGRGNMVAVVSDSTRVLGDGDCTPPGGLGVMEGKALLMKYLGGIDAVPLCIDSREGFAPGAKHDPKKIIDFVRMVAPSFGAINLEDISQPNCFIVLDELRETCDIPVWHDDAQGTACVTLAALLNALKLAGKSLANARIVLLGAGAANSTVARLILAEGGSPDALTLFDIKGALHTGRRDLEEDPGFYRQWELCQKTNPKRISSIEEAVRGADVLLALSAPGPGTVRPEWVATMAKNAIVFACANPVPEIWPHTALEAGAFIVATGRGDFPNQVNNSLCFPGLLKGTLLARARKITDSIALHCARSIAAFSERGDLRPDRIIADMSELELFADTAGAAAEAAVAEGLARVHISREDATTRARADIVAARNIANQINI